MAPVTAASEKNVGGEDVNARPFSLPAEALEVVPGLIVTQHSGDGNANQYFLRGFNLDHGTDLAISVDDMPGQAQAEARRMLALLMTPPDVTAETATNGSATKRLHRRALLFGHRNA